MHLYDFGISQEDPLTEYKLLDIQPGDQVLCIASGGEVPLTLACLQPGLKITAVDISETQLRLCRLKMQAAVHLAFPQNGIFLGYARAEKKIRCKIYFDKIKTTLTKSDQDFWGKNITAIENGVVNHGRFENYIKYLRLVTRIIFGRKNISRLLACTSMAEQENVFEKYIGNRKSVKWLFKFAFHPAVYKNRGLNAQGLMHAHTNTGELFFNKFKSFCTATPASNNYFLHYFLAGSCMTTEAFPEYLQEKYHTVLTQVVANINWKHTSLENELANHTPGTYNKIHLSNTGDWMSEENFVRFLEIICVHATGKEKLCYRFLQKNHFADREMCAGRFEVTAADIEKTDRFPFYSVLSIASHG